MGLKLYNTLTRKKEVFAPLRRTRRGGGKVNLFVCGITPYDFAHLGHARTYIAFDMISKYLRQKDFNVFYLQNITDIEDKILIRAKKEKISWKELGRKFEREYLKNMKALNITSVTKYARATDYMKEIINQVGRLMEKGFAYQIKDGIYFDIKKFSDYGKLSRRSVSQAEDAVSRIDESKGKKNRGDFCLWRFSPRLRSGQAKPTEPSWPSPWGSGRPGWHIEDTAITEKYFGSQYDIHGGARDLIFPHHEAEIAQMEAISGKKPIVKYWLHTGFLTVKGRKMAKSLGNFITIQDFLKNHSPRLLRFLILKSHYRSPIDYSERAISQAERELERIDEFIGKVQNAKFETRNKSQFPISKFQKDFEKAMEDDFNTPAALAAVFRLINQGNQLLAKGKLSSTDARDILEFLKKIDRIFSLIFFGRVKKEETPKEILKLVKERDKYRKGGDYKKADEIRMKAKQKGYWIEDTKEGPKIKRL